MKTIIVKYHGATNTKGSRYSATTNEGKCRIYMSYDYSLNSGENQARCAALLVKKLGWNWDRMTDFPLSADTSIYIPLTLTNGQEPALAYSVTVDACLQGSEDDKVAMMAKSGEIVEIIKH